MTGVITTCRTCGKEHEPSPEAIRLGQWRVRATCNGNQGPVPSPTEPSHCERCGRPLRNTARTICMGCLFGEVPL